ncbi:MAG TPA: hypothetical protein VN581_02570 [Patescibacteria group bacterium]|nr:hypothetical protein [Patescibacteria group bacterium]
MRRGGDLHRFRHAARLQLREHHAEQRDDQHREEDHVGRIALAADDADREIDPDHEEPGCGGDAGGEDVGVAAGHAQCQFEAGADAAEQQAHDDEIKG